MKVNKYSNKPYFPLVKIESHISFTLFFFYYIFWRHYWLCKCAL